MIKKTTHLDWLGAIRGAAALYVVCHHAVMQVIVIGDHAHDPVYRLLQLLPSYGHEPIITLVWKYMVIPMSLLFYWLQALTELIVGLLATVSVAMLIYKYIELPCHQLSKSIVKR